MKYHFPKIVKSVLMTGTILCFLTALCTSSHAETTLKLGTVDIKKVYDNWDVRLKASLEFEPQKKDLQAKADALKEAKDNYRIKSTAWNDDKKKTELENIQKMDNEFQKEYTDVGSKLDKKSQDLSAQLDVLLQKAYDDLSKKDGYTLILDNRFVLYMSTGAGTDLTDKVSDLVNKNSDTKDDSKVTGKSSNNDNPAPKTKSNK